jgi:hypothetical protein
VTTGRAGQQVDDLCRACKAVRHHTVMATDADGEIVRVVCDFCRSEHNYRSGGGVRTAPSAPAAEAMVSDRERSSPKMSSDEAGSDLETLLRRVIREEAGLTPVAPAQRWRGGQLVLRPASASLQEKAWPIESFFHKVVMLRNRLRTLEQQVNASDLPDEQKVKLQGYVTGCYGTLTSFNILFAEEEDHFKGGSGE